MQDPPGRFLELDSNSSCWIVASDERAIDKACQALRDSKCGKTLPISSERKRKRKILDRPFDSNNKVSKTWNQDHNACTSNKGTEKEHNDTHAQIEQNPSVDLSVYDDLILASLRTYYRSNHE